jgi:hypothetical protein
MEPVRPFESFHVPIAAQFPASTVSSISFPAASVFLIWEYISWWPFFETKKEAEVEYEKLGKIILGSVPESFIGASHGAAALNLAEANRFATASLVSYDSGFLRHTHPNPTLMSFAKLPLGTINFTCLRADCLTTLSVETRTRERQGVRIETVRISLPGLVTDAYLGIDNQTKGGEGFSPGSIPLQWC